MGSDLYSDRDPSDTISGLKFATVKDAEASVTKIKKSGRSHAHKVQAAVAMEQRAKAAGKKSAAGVYRSYINSVKKESVVREYVREVLIKPTLEAKSMLVETVSPEKVQMLAKELAAAEEKGGIGNIGEEIALLYQGGENLNDTKRGDFPFADVTSGPIDRLEDIGLYSVKATGAKRTSKSGFYTAKNAFGQSEIHTNTAVTMVNKKGWGGFRTEIDEQFGEDATEIELNLGAIAISVVPNRDSGEPEALRVWKYGPRKVKFQKNERGEFEPVGFPSTTITSDKKAASIFGPRQVLSSSTGQRDSSGQKTDTLLSFDPYANPKERAKAKEKII